MHWARLVDNHANAFLAKIMIMTMKTSRNKIEVKRSWWNRRKNKKKNVGAENLNAEGNTAIASVLMKDALNSVNV